MRLFTIFFIFLISSVSWAATDICDTIFRSSNVGCTDLASSHSSGGSYPLLFDAFNFNPSALPTFPSPVGVEAYYDNKKLNFALIKGLENVGFGASAKKTDTTFFSGVENYKVALKKSALSSYNTSSLDQNFNIGSALSFLKIKELINIPLGLAYRYNSEKKSWSFNPGFEMRTSLFTAGISFFTEKPHRYNDGFNDVQETRSNVSINGGFKLRNFLIDYSMIREKNDATYTSATGPSFTYNSNYTVVTQIFSAIYVDGKLSLTSAYRTQNDSRLEGVYATQMSANGLNYQRSHFLAGTSFKTDIIEVGAFYNYVLNNDLSLLFKFFF